MKVEQILYTRMGGAELGAGWQSRTSEKFSSEVEKNCIYQFNCIVDSLLDKSRKTPEDIYTVWHANKHLCAAKAKKLIDQTGRGNILAQAYVVNDSDYISALSKPTEFLCISEFYNEVTDKPPVLDSLPQSNQIAVRDVCHRYSITSAKMEQLIILILSAAMRKNDHKRALKIVVNKSLDELYKLSQEIMSAVMSFVPCVVRFNTSFASFEHPKLEGMSVLFTNTTPNDYYFNLDTGEWSWPANMLIPEKDVAGTFIANASNSAFQKDIEDFVYQTGRINNFQWDDLVAAYIYACVKNNINVSFAEDELFKAMTNALKDTRVGINEDYLAMLVILYVNSGGKMSANHYEQLTARYKKTKNPAFKSAIEMCNFSHYVNDFSEKKFAAFCAMQKTSPEIYNNIVTMALEQGKSEFLGKVENDIVRSKDIHSAFENAVSDSTQRGVYVHMLKNMYFNGTYEGYKAFSDLKKKIPKLYKELNDIELSLNPDDLKKYYEQYFVPNEASDFDILVDIKNIFGSGYDDELKNASLQRLIDLFTQLCKEQCRPEVKKKYKDTVYKLCDSVMDAELISQYEDMAKSAFWQFFSVTSWRRDDSYSDLKVYGLEKCNTLCELESLARSLKSSDIPGDPVYNKIIKNVLSSQEFSKEERSHIMKQLQGCTKMKLGRTTVDDMIINAIRAETMQFDTNALFAAFKGNYLRITESDLRRSTMLPYLIKARGSSQGMATIYKNLMEDGSGVNQRFLDAFERVCNLNGLNLGRVRKEAKKSSMTDSLRLIGLSSLTALCAGISLSILNNYIQNYHSNIGMLSTVILFVAAVIFVVAIILFGVSGRKLSGAVNMDPIETLLFVVAVIALLTFGICFEMGAIIIAVMLLLSNIALLFADKK